MKYFELLLVYPKINGIECIFHPNLFFSDMPEPDNSDEFDNASESDDMGGSDDEADPNAGSRFFVPQNPDDYAVPNAWDGINGASEADDFDGIDDMAEPDDIAGSGGWVLDDASDASGDGIQDPDWVYVD